MKSLQLRFVPAAEYYESLLTHIPKAKRRVVIHAMIVLWQPHTEKILALLHDALNRGVEVRIVGDMYSKLQANMPKFVRNGQGPRWGHTIALNSELESKGGHVAYVGKLGFNPYKQRCHSKITIIDDLCYTFGGVNFYAGGFLVHDYMLECRNHDLSDRLYALIRDIEQYPRMADITEKLDQDNTLLFDGGTPGSSVIYDAACEAVAKAKKVYYISQMCPSGRLARLLTKTDNECYFIRPSQADPPSNLALIVDQARYGIKNLYKGKGYIHAKCILCENQDGTKQLISGSNNFSWRGIAYGTKEIAVSSTNAGLWQQFYNFMKKEIMA
ncbi:MAG TPA: phospholipase D-like domain-containing protein [Candidatus Saccharimonadales bacterium]|nr:phospholipase D-like domain-containing protein [Candidatus Saccharimonadales bacterium]